MDSIEVTLNRGVVAWEKGDRASALVDLRQAAAAGHPVGCFNLAVALTEMNSGTYSDEALGLFRAAADKGHAAASFNLGQAARLGDGVSVDPAEAARRYRIAAEAGNHQAANELGLMYVDGVGVPKDPVEGYAWIYPGTHVVIGDKAAIANCARLAALLSPADLELAEARGRDYCKRYILSGMRGGPSAALQAGSPSSRKEREVWLRARVCLALAWKAFAQDPAVLEKLLDQASREALTPAEAAFLAAPKPLAADVSRYSWSLEPAFILLWALGGEPVETGFATQTTNRDVLGMSAALKPGVQSGALAFRDPDSLEEALDSLLSLGWACRDARLRGKSAPDGVDPAVVTERGKALVWLIQQTDRRWDDVVFRP